MNGNEVVKELGRVFCKECSYMKRGKEKDIELQAMRNAANSYKAEVERLNTNIHSMAITMSNSAKHERAEAYKEFAERLKKNFETYTDDEEPNVLYIRNLIDNLVKEMTEGKDDVCTRL